MSSSASSAAAPPPHPHPCAAVSPRVLSLLSRLSRALQCPLCAHLLTHPVTLPCSHHFCGRCLRALSAAQHSSGEGRCPHPSHCGRPFWSREMAVNRQLHGVVEAFVRMRSAITAQKGRRGAEEEGKEEKAEAEELPSPLRRLQRLSEPSSDEVDEVEEEEEEGSAAVAEGSTPPPQLLRTSARGRAGGVSEAGSGARASARGAAAVSAGRGNKSAQRRVAGDSNRFSARPLTTRKWRQQSRSTDGGDVAATVGKGNEREVGRAHRQVGVEADAEEEEEESHAQGSALFPHLLVDEMVARRSRRLVREEAGTQLLTRHFLHPHHPTPAGSTVPCVLELQPAVDIAMEDIDSPRCVHRPSSPTASSPTALAAAPLSDAAADEPRLPPAGGASLPPSPPGPSLRSAAALPSLFAAPSPILAVQPPPPSAPPPAPPPAVVSDALLASLSVASSERALWAPSAAERGAVVVLMTAVERELVSALKLQVQALGGVVVNRFSSSVTHLLSPFASSPHYPLHLRLTKRTSKFLLAVLAGQWVVDVDWVRQSHVEGRWLQEAAFEVQGDLVLGAAQGPTKGRQAKLARTSAAASSPPSPSSIPHSPAPPPLLSSFVLLWLTPMSAKEPSYEVLAQLAQLGGAELRPPVDCEAMEGQADVQESARQLRALHSQLHTEPITTAHAHPRHALLVCRPDLRDYLAQSPHRTHSTPAAARCLALLSSLLPLLTEQSRRLSLVNLCWLLDSVSSHSLKPLQGNKRYDAALECNQFITQHHAAIAL